MCSSNSCSPPVGYWQGSRWWMLCQPESERKQLPTPGDVSFECLSPQLNLAPEECAECCKGHWRVFPNSCTKKPVWNNCYRLQDIQNRHKVDHSLSHARTRTLQSPQGLTQRAHSSASSFPYYYCFVLTALVILELTLYPELALNLEICLPVPTQCWNGGCATDYQMKSNYIP